MAHILCLLLMPTTTKAPLQGSHQHPYNKRFYVIHDPQGRGAKLCARARVRPAPQTPRKHSHPKRHNKCHAYTATNAAHKHATNTVPNAAHTPSTLKNQGLGIIRSLDNMFNPQIVGLVHTLKFEGDRQSVPHRNRLTILTAWHEFRQ